MERCVRTWWGDCSEASADTNRFGKNPSALTVFNGTGIIPKDSVVAIRVGRIDGMANDGETPRSAAFSTISSRSQVSKCP